MNSKLILGVVVAVYACYVDGHPQQSCGSGSCISLSDCPYLKTLSDTNNKSPQEKELLQKSECGLEGDTLKVCCDPCNNPDGYPGVCVNIDQCAHLADMLNKPSRDDDKVYVANTRCVGPEHPSVCCGPPRDLTYVQNAKCTGILTAFPPDAMSKCCGRDSSSGNRIQGGKETNLDQYTWMALLKYSNKGPFTTLCSGSLISGKYVLTAAHCITGPSGEPTNVVLAEYDLTNPGIDCMKVPGEGLECNNGTVTIPIEKVIVHPEYNVDKKQAKHDIALIRLQRSAPFTDFIRPICLPTVDHTLDPPKDLTFFVAGWGTVSTEERVSKFKQAVELPFVQADTCQQAYSKPEKMIELGPGQLCAGGKLNKDAREGDSGGPLMYEDPMTRSNELIGIVSFGSRTGFKDDYGVYTKVFAYRDWILNTIEP